MKKDSKGFEKKNSRQESQRTHMGWQPSIRFKQNLDQKRVKTELWILEGEDDFEGLTHRAKVSRVARQGDDEFTDWLMKKDIEGELPESWPEFKQLIISYCTGTTMKSIHQYDNETYSNYIKRLRDISKLNGIQEEEVITKLQKSYTDYRFQPIIYAGNLDISNIIEKVEFIETLNNNTRRNKISKSSEKTRYNRQHNHQDPKRFTFDKKSIQCYNCKKYGHYKNECQSSSENKQLNTLEKAKCMREIKSNIDVRKVQIEGVEMDVLFDSGACESIIGLKTVRKLIKNPRFDEQKKNLKFFNNSEFNIKRTIDLNISYNGKTFLDTFNVYEDPKCDKILLCYNTIKFLQEKEKEFKEIPIICEINTLGGGPVSWTRPIRSLTERSELMKLTEDMERRGIIEKSNFLWLNPVVLTKKKDVKYRFTVDFRRLNDLVTIDEFEIPRISQLMTVLRDQAWFTTIDLKDGFYHIKVRDEDKEKTTFAARTKLYQFKYMPQGFKNSPAIFQRAMTLMFEDLIDVCCLIYIDDILVFGKTLEEHDKNLALVIERMKIYNLIENENKGQKRVEEVNFLGYKIRKNIIQPLTKRAEGIANYKTLRSRKELQRFFRMINYDRMFIKGITDLAAPLYKALELEKPFVWTNEQEESFSLLKKRWTDSLELIVPNFNEEFTLETDASDAGIGGVLRQSHGPIAYVSRSLRGAEKRYSVTEKEVLAMIWCMEKLEFYLMGKKFIVITDHEAISFIKEKKEFGSYRIQRWHERMDRFTFEVNFRPGEMNIQPDALSRSTLTNINAAEINKGIVEKIMEIHSRYKHRKTIYDKVKEANIEITQNELRNILKNCEKCMTKDIEVGNNYKMIRSTRPGELIGADLLEISPRERIIVLIDYFSRKLFAKYFNKEIR